MMLNVTNVNQKYFKVLMTLPNKPQKKQLEKSTEFCEKNSEVEPQFSEIIEPSSSVIIDKCQFQVTDFENIFTLPSI